MTKFLKHMVALLTLFPMTGVYASSYQQVHDVVFTQAEINDNDTAKVQAEKSVYLAGDLPTYQVTAKKLTKQLTKRLANRSKQTLVDEVDYYDRLEKLVHSNGICMAGTWYITEQAKNADNQAYTGLFAHGAVSPFIGRLSVALSETKRGERQGFGMAGKLFGTQDIHQSVTTENFFVADVLTGTYRDSVFDAPMTNKPKIELRFGILSLGLKIAPLFRKADKNPSMRPVSNLARMGLAENQTPVAPLFMMIQPIQPDNLNQSDINSAQSDIDFRDEFALIEDNSTPNTLANKASRYFAIYVSDTSSQPSQPDWQHLGFIKADETVVSYGCDRQLHFNHPKDDGKL